MLTGNCYINFMTRDNFLTPSGHLQDMTDQRIACAKVTSNTSTEFFPHKKRDRKFQNNKLGLENCQFATKSLATLVS